MLSLYLKFQKLDEGIHQLPTILDVFNFGQSFIRNVKTSEIFCVPNLKASEIFRDIYCPQDIFKTYFILLFILLGLNILPFSLLSISDLGRKSLKSGTKKFNFSIPAAKVRQKCQNRGKNKGNILSESRYFVRNVDFNVWTKIIKNAPTIRVVPLCDHLNIGIYQLCTLG